MRFLVDQCLSAELAQVLADAGHDVTHLRDLGMQRAKDPQVLELARAEDRVLLSADTDFGALLARTAATRPSAPTRALYQPSSSPLVRRGSAVRTLLPPPRKAGEEHDYRSSESWRQPWRCLPGARGGPGRSGCGSGWRLSGRLSTGRPSCRRWRLLAGVRSGARRYRLVWHRPL